MFHRKKKIDKLAYPSWFGWVSFVLRILAPIGLVFVEGMKAPKGFLGTTFKWSFASICAAIIAWFFINKFVINKKKTELISKQAALEHDYSIEVGNPKKIKMLWYSNERKLAIFEAITVSLYGGLIAVILLAVSSKLMQIKGLVLIIMSLYLLAYALKFIVIVWSGGINDEEAKDEIPDTTEDD